MRKFTKVHNKGFGTCCGDYPREWMKYYHENDNTPKSEMAIPGSDPKPLTKTEIVESVIEALDKKQKEKDEKIQNNQRRINDITIGALIVFIILMIAFIAFMIGVDFGRDIGVMTGMPSGKFISFLVK